MDWLLVGVAVVASGWFAAAGVLLANSFVVTRHAEPLPSRLAAVRRLRVANSAALILVTGLLLIGLAWLQFGAGGGVLPVSALIVGMLLALAYLFLAILTVSLPDLPGRSWLRRIENIGGIAFCAALAGFAVYALRFAEPTAPLRVAIVAGVLSLLYGFFMLARPYLRGALTVAEHIASHGSHATREATLKRLMRRYRPFLAASVAALVFGLVAVY